MQDFQLVAEQSFLQFLFLVERIRSQCVLAIHSFFPFVLQNKTPPSKAGRGHLVLFLYYQRGRRELADPSAELSLTAACDCAAVALLLEPSDF